MTRDGNTPVQQWTFHQGHQRRARVGRTASSRHLLCCSSFRHKREAPSPVLCFVFLSFLNDAFPQAMLTSLQQEPSGAIDAS
jgi:hypothetical protein